MADGDQGREERREHPRRIVCMIAYVEPEDVPKDAAVVRDMSLSGAYLLCRLGVKAGEQVVLAIHFPEGGAEHRVEETTATVVRVESLDKDRAGFWPTGIAVQFVDPLDHLAGDIEHVADLTAKLGLAKQ